MYITFPTNVLGYYFFLNIISSYLHGLWESGKCGTLSFMLHYIWLSFFIGLQFVDPATPQLQLEVPEEWVCDMSSLFLGKKFASGNHSRLYHGVYKDQDVAVKLLRLDECEEEAAKLERQFMQEVYCLSQLQHPNIVKVTSVFWLFLYVVFVVFLDSYRTHCQDAVKIWEMDWTVISGIITNTDCVDYWALWI